MGNFKLPIALVAAMLVMAASIATLAGPRIAMPEQGELDRFLGTWQLHMTVYPAVWTPQETILESTYTSQWILGGRYVQQSSQDYLKLYTYDSGARVYRYWFFDSSGIAVEARGDWNDKTKSFVWLSSAGPGLTTTVTHHFLDDDTIDLTIIIQDNNGKVYYHSKSQSTRMKSQRSKASVRRDRPLLK